MRGRLGVGRSIAALAGAFGIALAVGLGTPAVCRAAAAVPFPRPAGIEPNVNFWVDAFTAYSVRDFVVLDRDNVWRIYQVFHLPGTGQPSREDIQWSNAYLKAKYGDILNHLAAGHSPETADERRVAAMFNGEGSGAYALAAQNLRVQEGLRERFREGLLRSRYYRPTMERIFSQAGLPPELVTLAQIESGFESRAHSSAGACGIWQFTRATGRKYLRITRYRDDRLNPIRSTEAAAKLLRYNYNVLGDWPLAITAYNYGAGGTARAAESSGGNYARMVARYNGPHFGFAVKNYYAEFLAALQVHRDEDVYFPGIETAKAYIAATHSYTIRKGDTPSKIGQMYGVSPRALMAANGISSPRDLRIGAEIVIPAANEASLDSGGTNTRPRHTHKPRHTRRVKHASNRPSDRVRLS
ncbi:MAG TPA: transglycosylase SLT domain-containing protein [Candidatus Binataceae bacterium]|nr:transglycosylase SLT domain-containing protein [Candidatus Binataceae bacterium]